MAKVKFSKLNLKVDKGVKTVNIQDVNGEDVQIEISNYLPLKDKIKMISVAVESSIINGVIRGDVMNAVLILEIVKKYTNLQFTPTMLEKELDLYDVLESNGIVHEILKGMEETELNQLEEYTEAYASEMRTALASSVSGFAAQQKAVQDAVQTLIDNNFDFHPEESTE